MMVVCKDQLDQLQASERMGAVAAAAVEADVTALLATKSYDDLVVLQKQIQAKLSSGEPVDIDYWESLLKKLLVWKAKVSHRSISARCMTNSEDPRPSSRPSMKSWSEIDSSNFVRGRETKLSKLRKNYWQELLSQRLATGEVMVAPRLFKRMPLSKKLFLRKT
jgi:hypothetical protein